MHEASLHSENCFVTLTYRDEDLPPGGSLVKGDHQKFMKRLRKRYSGARISYFMCGEYGDRDGRPHFHFILFGHDFLDKEEWTKSGPHWLYRSAELEELWPFGHSWIGSVTLDSCAYVARYVLKKVNGDLALDRYVQDIDLDTGECTYLEPEYVSMSRRPAIGLGWYEAFSSDCQKDFLTMDGTWYNVPSYYDRQLERRDPDALARVKRKRKEVANANSVTRKRLSELEKVTEHRIKRLVRSL